MPSFGPGTGHFRSTPIYGLGQRRAGCVKGARTDSGHALAATSTIDAVVPLTRAGRVPGISSRHRRRGRLLIFESNALRIVRLEPFVGRLVAGGHLEMVGMPNAVCC